MNSNICTQCGSNELIDKGGYLVCAYCGTQFQKEVTKKATTISINADIDRLLQKCKKEPKKASHYASLILDIDPANQEARHYL